MTLASYGPPSMVLGRSLLARWARRGLAVAGGTLLVWVAARLWPTAAGAGWATGVALLVVLAGVLGLARALGARR